MVGTVSVSLTNKCNLKCRMCGSQNMINTPDPKIMSEKTWSNIIRKIPAGWTLEINACGEHTTHPDFLNFIEQLKTTRQRHNRIKLSTNGMWGWNNAATMKMIATMREIFVRSGKSQIFFSIDGGTNETVEWVRRGCSLDKIMSNVRLAIKEAKGSLLVGVNYIAMKRTLHEAITLLDRLPGLNIFYLNLLTTTTQDMVAESLFDSKDEYLEEAELIRQYCVSHDIVMLHYHPSEKQEKSLVNGCSFPCYMWVDPDGFVYPCCVRWDRPIGNINDLTWNEIVNEGWKKLRSIIHEEGCNNCFQTDTDWGWQKHFSSKEWFDKYKAQRTKQ